MTNRLKTIERLELELHPTDDSRSTSISKLRGLYETLAEQLFQQFEPTRKVSPRVSRDFMVRLNDWLEHFENDEDKWTALKSIQYVFFAGHFEFEELYRCAVENKIKPWLIDIKGIDIFEEDALKKLDDELDKCWPCPVSDSLRINGFLHLTGLKGKNLRPDWMSMKQFATADSIQKYQTKEGIDYLILIEDFVGSGDQFSKVLKFAAENFRGPIILTPLIVCAPGDKKIKETIALLNHDISYRPVTVLSEDCLITDKPTPGEPKLFSKLRDVLKTGYTIMNSSLDGAEYGWKKTGSLVVLYSNCPNNTPPIYHHHTATWQPLFPRSEREFKAAP